MLLLSLLACEGSRRNQDWRAYESCSPHGNLELVVLDVWARPVDATVGGELQPGAWSMLRKEPRSWTVTLSAPDHLDDSFVISWNGVDDYSVFQPEHGRVVSSEDVVDVDGDACTLRTVFVGMDHAWFAAHGPPPTRNEVELLINGEEAWESVYADLNRARDRITWSTWFWESDFEFVRPNGHHNMSESQRGQYTSLAVLEDQDVWRRILVNRFWGENSDYAEYLNTDSALRDYASKMGDGFEMILQGNTTEVPTSGTYDAIAPTYSFLERVQANYPDRTWKTWDEVQARRLDVDAASYHQKAAVIDGQVAYVGGMNTKAADWDTRDHEVFNEKRMTFEASAAEREAVLNREELPDVTPRRDYMMRIEGPVAGDVEEYLRARWELGMTEGALYAEYATKFEVEGVLDEIEGGVPTQVTVSLPEPLAEQSIWETHAKAFAQAEEYIFIEDQYFRAPMMNDIIAERMRQEPELVLIVVTMSVSEWDPGLKYTYLSDEFFQEFGDRYLVLQTRTADMVAEEGWVWDDVYWYDLPLNLHSKLRLVDDRYLSVGSCNFNNRGYKYEGEMNVSVLDDATAKKARKTIFKELVGPDLAPYLSDDPQNNLDVMLSAAEYNAQIFDWWDTWAEDLTAAEAEETWAEYPPSGFLHPVEFSDDYFDVGPDLF